MHRFLLHRKRSATAPVISVKYRRIFALNSALHESRLATLSTQIFVRQTTSRRVLSEFSKRYRWVSANLSCFFYRRCRRDI